jgi:hypothetical protein
VRLTVTDVTGRAVTTLVDGVRNAGQYAAVWDGTAAGKRVPPGMYFVRLRTPDFSMVRRLAIVR